MAYPTVNIIKTLKDKFHKNELPPIVREVKIAKPADNSAECGTDPARKYKFLAAIIALIIAKEAEEDKITAIHIKLTFPGRAR
jgi:hypothetical protein